MSLYIVEYNKYGHKLNKKLDNDTLKIIMDSFKDYCECNIKCTENDEEIFFSNFNKLASSFLENFEEVD